MGDKEVKNKKGFMSRFPSFRKKKSSSKHGSVTSLKTGSGDSVARGEDGRRMVTDIDRRSKVSSYVSSSQNSLEGINGRTRSTSELIAGYEKKLSIVKDDSKPTAQAFKRSSATNSTSSQESESSFRVTPGVSANAESVNVKGHGQTTAQPSFTHQSGVKPYRSIFTDVTKSEGTVLNSWEKTEGTTQTNFSQIAHGEDDVARLVKVQSSRTPETKRAHLSIARQNNETVSNSNYRPLVGKETFIGPDPITPGKGVEESRLRFRSTSTPMPKSSEVVVEPTTSPISTSNDLVPSHVPHTSEGQQIQNVREIETSFPPSSSDSRREGNTSGVMNLQGSKRTERDIWTKQEPSSDNKIPVNLLEVNKGSNMTFTKTPLPHNTSMPGHQAREQTPTTIVNRTVVVEKGTTRTPSKDLAGRTFSVESNCVDSLCSDDLMCDSKFTGLEETTFPDSDTTIEAHIRPTRDADRNKPRNQWRKGSEGDSISSSLPSSLSPLSSPSRVKLNSAERDSCVVLDAVVYNGMVKELSAMRLMLRKLSTLLHEEKVVKMRTSEAQYDPRWNRCDQDTQTEISELSSSSSVSVAAVQCNLHPEKLTCGSQYEKPRELPKPSKIAAPASKLTKPRTTQHSSKVPTTGREPTSIPSASVGRENGPAAQSSQLTTEPGKSCHPPDEERDEVTKGGEEEEGDDEKRDDMKVGDCSTVTDKTPEFSSVEIKVKDAHDTDLSMTGPQLDREVEMSNKMSELSKDLPHNKGGGTDITTGVGVLPQRGRMKILGDSDDRDNKNSLSEETDLKEMLKGKESEIQVKGDDPMEVGEIQTGKPRSNSMQGNTSRDGSPADEGKDTGSERSDISSKSDEDDTPEETNKSSIQRQSLPKPNSPSKLSKLQPYKTTNLRYSQTIKTVKTEKISYSSGSNPAKPQGGLRPPQWSKTEKMTSDHQSSLKSSEKQSELHRMDNNIPKLNNPSQLPPTKRHSSNENISLSSKNVKTESTFTSKDNTVQGGFSGSRPTGVNRPPKPQRPQSAISQLKLMAPTSYSNLAQRKAIERPPEGTLSDSSDGKSVDDNGNSSTSGSAENINANVRSIPGVTKTGGSKLPKVKQTSRLPRGRGIPRMNPR